MIHDRTDGLMLPLMKRATPSMRTICVRLEEHGQYRNNMSVRQKNLHHIKFLLSSYYKHGHELGYMFHAYLNIVCTAMERINNLSRPAFMFSGASVTAGMVDQYQDQTFVKKIRLYRVQSENLTARAIMKKVVFRISRRATH
ncbi:2-succinyl-5-enolpyruvyl-6-hydroxy-3-cyclohexene-1-carboxylate synthase [Striga asiatica]|uniref:2-succinyl-5-enolpyruvyl-6-hydroxy-3-cyclohexene-1-carboxylate synthase n=1 Tax=Striga asiatica TaxID=4170 RepID=A0A5A7P9W4_STRAF|nr:2-succinyl-5-enolpyruvyl-6-hydroxy-3-cyclohexene-1-carboxylate synthase [Striga asiatica]